MLAGIGTWLLKMLLPMGLDLLKSYLEKAKATADELAVFDSFKRMIQGKGLLSADLSEDYENQKPPVKPESPKP